MSNTPNPSYFQQRLADLGITPEINSHVIRRESMKDKWTEEQAKFFSEDEEGNIVIHYFNLRGLPYSWKKEDAKWPISFVRKRLKQPKGDQKYHQDKGSGLWPFFTPGVLKKYAQCKEAVRIDGAPVAPIETLIIVEGEFKAFKGGMAGLDIIGIPSIHGFYNGDVRGKLHEDIQEVIVTCGVKKVVYLVDADLLSVKWEEKKDLAKRPESFFAAVKLFRESLQLLMDDEKVDLEMVYLMHLNSKFMNDAKGLDDLLCKYSAQTEEIIKDLLEFQFAKKFFSGKVLNDPNKDLQKVRQYLGLYDEQEFYKCYGDFIGDREFLFRNKRYEYNRDKKEVVFVRHEDADRYMRVGPDWIKMIRKTNTYGQIDEEMKPWSIAEITRDYKVGKNAEFFISQLQRYDDFCNEPAWNGSYKRVHNNCYNLCNPLKWEPKAGVFPNTYKLLKHIFQGAGDLQILSDGTIEEKPVLGDQFTVILDWLSILLREPKQMLPVPILVSKENGTGKSTFLKWLNMIFGSNMCILGNEQFKMKFNGHYITKFIIAIDEGFLDVDKKAEKERLKQLVTANVAYLENKGMNVATVPFYGKLVICSNDADRVMKIDDGESRWFVVKVPVIPKKELTGKELIDAGETMIEGVAVDPEKKYQIGDQDPDLEKKMMLEIPAVLYFLKERKIHHPRASRLWFKPEWFITDQMKVIVEQTKNRVDRVFEDWIAEQFLVYKLPTLRYSMGFLTEVFNDPKNSKYRIDAIELKSYLKDRRGMEPADVCRINIPTGFLEDGNIQYKSVTARPLTFEHTRWLNKEQLENWSSPGLSIEPQRPPSSEPPKPQINKKTDDELPF